MEPSEFLEKYGHDSDKVPIWLLIGIGVVLLIVICARISSKKACAADAVGATLGDAVIATFIFAMLLMGLIVWTVR